MRLRATRRRASAMRKCIPAAAIVTHSHET
jgi:hypothetical protein